MSTKNRTRRTTAQRIRFPNQMIEQLTSLLSKKGRISQWVDWSLPSETNVEKRAYTSIKSDEEWTSRVLFPSRQDDI